MKIILKQDVKSLGKKDALVEVSDGYARNYIIPKGLGVEANSVNVNDVKNRKEAESARAKKELEHARQLAQRLSELSVVIKTKTGEQGKLFGSIGSKEIADNIKSVFKLDVDRKKINLAAPIKSTGDFEIDVRLHPAVS